MGKKTCPECGFRAHRLCSYDGKKWKYICERCKCIFISDD